MTSPNLSHIARMWLATPPRPRLTPPRLSAACEYRVCGSVMVGSTPGELQAALVRHDRHSCREAARRRARAAVQG